MTHPNTGKPATLSLLMCIMTLRANSFTSIKTEASSTCFFFSKNLNKSSLYLSEVWCSLNLLCLIIKCMNSLKVVNLKTIVENLQSCFYGTVSLTLAVASNLLIWSSLTGSFLIYFYFCFYILLLLFTLFNFLFTFYLEF